MTKKNCREKRFHYNYPELGMRPFEIRACNKKDAINKYKERYVYAFGKKNLPRGFQIWEAPKKAEPKKGYDPTDIQWM